MSQMEATAPLPEASATPPEASTTPPEASTTPPEQVADGNQLVVYATVPAGARAGDTLAVDVFGRMLEAVVPEGCGPGDSFGVVE